MSLQAPIVDVASGARAAKAHFSVPRLLFRFTDGDQVDVRVAMWGSAKAKAQGLQPIREFWARTTLENLKVYAHKGDGVDARPAAYRWLKKREPGAGEPDLRKAKDV